MSKVNACIIDARSHSGDGSSGGGGWLRCLPFVLDSGAQMSILDDDYGYPAVGEVYLEGFDPQLGVVTVPVVDAFYLVPASDFYYWVRLPSAVIPGGQPLLSVVQLVSAGFTVEFTELGPIIHHV